MDINNLAKEINKQLALYANFVEEEIDAVAKEVAGKAVTKLKQTSPVGDYTGGGQYASGWKVKKQKGKYIVHNATNYQLTHLLEKGHATIDGGRTKAIPHIKPVEVETNKDFEKELIKRISE
ncbi:HK97 gp10 family phage protein [Lysinibacillus sp. RC79]|uniref:HK97 gp10 family phage protein n=1 Tax=Lysinibacillus sp. RC79 TaxID=3156296 RepID=UPI003518DEF2